MVHFEMLRKSFSLNEDTTTEAVIVASSTASKLANEMPVSWEKL
jgi:hypothetical protein